jgi:hypothetical protein
MNPTIEFNLTLILFLPWFLILGVLFWFYPRQPRGAGRRGYDLAALVLALLASWAAMRWGMLNADANAGTIWKQVLATLTAYGAFLAVLGLAWWLRARLLAGARR